VVKLRGMLTALLALMPMSLGAVAQDKPKPDIKSTTLKVQVTFTESEGDRKLANLPYTFFIKAIEAGPGSPYSAPFTKVRIGSRVPVYAGKEGMQYIDVGTNIDARGTSADDGLFDIMLNLERSWVEGDVSVPIEKQSAEAADPNAMRFKQPIIRQFKTELNLRLRDGQTIQTTQAADPLSGRLLTIAVTISVVK
jgi:hypothetical protein